jgi:cellulose 1,4-beta-cellobiosidase
MLKLGVLTTLLAAAAAQQVGTLTTETHPKMTWNKCSSGGSCTKQNGEVTIDANWRWVHDTKSTKNCYDGNKWTDLCSDEKDCATKCALDGADYPATYGASTSGDALTLKFVTKGQYGKLPLETQKPGRSKPHAKEL